MMYREAWEMPVAARKWWINRTTKQMKKEAEEQEKANKRGRR